jgi:hypothetical protein
MNITPQYNSLPLATVFNPQTDNLRRENNQREIIAQPAAASQSAAEKGVASDKDKAKTPAQNAEQYDFVALQKQAEQEANTINGQAQQQNQQSQQQSSGQEQNNSTVEDGASDKNASTDSDNTQESKQNDSAAKLKQQEIDQLKARDQEVRQHEAAHAAVGGSATGSPSFSFEQGPDGIRYAVDGEVSVDLSPISGDPAATIAKMQKIHAAALAPVNPSSQDKSVAARATKAIAQAQAELLQIKDQPATRLINVKEAFKNGSESTTQANVNHESLASANDSSQKASQSFDQFIADTIEQQDAISPASSLKISADVEQRAVRIASFYHKIANAYDQPSNSQFKITA